QNFLPGNPANLRPNTSHFTRCHFVVDDAYRGADDFAAHVFMAKVDGIDFTGCTFENLQTQITESARLGAGIESIDASYRVIPACNVLTKPCPPQHMQRSVFRGLDHGIRASNSETARRFVVEHTDFHSNIAGIYANTVPGYRATNCRFYIGGRDVDLTGDVDEEFLGRHRGIFSTESWAFTVDDNELFQDGEHAATEGIVIGYSRDHDDVVFRNQATGLERGYIGEGICADVQGNSDRRGLWFLCNGNTGTGQNFWSRLVTTDDPIQQGSHSIRTSQGLSKRPADNTFDQLPGTDGEADFKVTTTYGAIDYWHRNTGAHVPLYHASLLLPQVMIASPQDNCARKIILIPEEPEEPSGMAPGPLTNELLARRAAYADTRHLYAQFIDGGDTDAVLAEVQESWPSDAWDLRASLLARSPSLSTEVLRQTVQRAIMPQAMLTEILVANPEATRSDGFIRWLQDASGHPLTENLLGLVVASWDLRTYRDVLENEMVLHHGEMTLAANALLHHYRSDTAGAQLDSVRWVWQQLRTPAARIGESLVWLEEQQFDSAAAAIACIPIENRLRPDGVAEVQRMQDWINFLQGVHADGRTTRQLDSAEVQQLVTLRGDAYDRPAALIANLLCTAYDICRPPLTGGDDGTPKSLPRTAWSSANAPPQAVLSIHPNPADAWVALDYDLLVPAQNAALVIRDMNGREVYRKALHHQRHQVVWDVRPVAPGTYTASLLVGERMLRTEKIIIRP
ncbi:MAG: T9SS type A sorting domain-containing protein, partial [Flavobacteriales bacterium]|nr:T9SS type A sorting domain-containing protein [Flavobacteriales bacterium]